MDVDNDNELTALDLKIIDWLNNETTRFYKYELECGCGYAKIDRYTLSKAQKERWTIEQKNKNSQ